MMLAQITLFVAVLANTVFAAPSQLVPRAPTCTYPSPPRTSSLSSARVVSGSFDGGNVRFDRGSGACGGGEGGEADAVFILQSGATLSNVVIGANQMEGVHCRGPCTLRNVWFEDVCEDAVSIKQTSGTSYIQGGGFKNGDDKSVQHNGGGTVNIDSVCIQNFGKLYRSCGNCSKQTKRIVNISNIIAKNGDVLAGVNSNFGDVATFSGTRSLSGVSSTCDTFQGVTSGEPKRLTRNVSNASCKF